MAKQDSTPSRHLVIVVKNDQKELVLLTLLVAAWLLASILFAVALGTKFWVVHQAENSNVGDNHGLFSYCFGEFYERETFCLSTNLTDPSVPNYIRSGQILSVITGLIIVVGTFLAASFRIAAMANRNNADLSFLDHRNTRLACSLTLIIAGVLMLGTCMAVASGADSKYDLIFYHSDNKNEESDEAFDPIKFLSNLFGSAVNAAKTGGLEGFKVFVSDAGDAVKKVTGTFGGTATGNYVLMQTKQSLGASFYCGVASASFYILTGIIAILLTFRLLKHDINLHGSVTNQHPYLPVNDKDRNSAGSNVAEQLEVGMDSTYDQSTVGKSSRYPSKSVKSTKNKTK